MIFTGQSGKFLGPAPDLFDDWQLYNGTDGIFYWTETSNSDAFLTAALQKQREKEKQCTYQDVVVSTLGPGDVFGELAILSNGTLVPSPVTVHADTGVELLIITANELRQYVRGGYFQRETGRLLRNYMCLKVPSADTVKNNVDNVTKWTSKKKEIVLNEVRLSAKNSQSTGSRIMRLNYTDANEIEELKKLLKKKHDWN